MHMHIVDLQHKADSIHIFMVKKKMESSFHDIRINCIVSSLMGKADMFWLYIFHNKEEDMDSYSDINTK